MRNYLIIGIIIGVLLSTNEAARILGYFPVPSISHQLAFRPLVHELARRGHEVTVITPNPAFAKGEAPKNLREIDVHDISYEIWKQRVGNYTTGSKNDMYKQVTIAMRLLGAIAEAQLRTPDVQNLINNKNETFDLLLLELCVRPTLVFSHFYKAPVIHISSLGAVFGTYESVGSPAQPLLYPQPLRQKLYNLTKWEKIVELYKHYYYEYLTSTYEDTENAALRKLFGDDVPPLSELNKKVDMVFLNAHPIWQDNRPVPPNVIFMGGIHVKPAKELPKDLKTYLDSSKHGVIYISFGSNVVPSTLPPHRMNILKSVFSKLPYDVLWKYDKEDMPGKPSNVRLQKWLPQSDLLRHSKIKLFITQGGLQSTDETIASGVPVIVFPMSADQWFNAERYVHHRIGIRLDLETVTEETFKNAIDTVITDKSYRQNIERLRAVMTDQPQKPLERAVWWAEHVMRHGGADHLKSPAAHISWWQYYEIDLVALVLASFLSLVSLIVYALFYLWRYVSSNFVTTIKIKKS